MLWVVAISVVFVVVVGGGGKERELSILLEGHCSAQLRVCNPVLALSSLFGFGRDLKVLLHIAVLISSSFGFEEGGVLLHVAPGLKILDSDRGS
jgi:hypothetical protein